MPTRTLLLADDSPVTQRVIELLFATHGVQVISVGTGHEASQQLIHARPDVALLSTNLPAPDGWALVKEVRRNPDLRRLPVLLIAGAYDTVHPERVRDSGADGVIVKPFDSAEVISRVKSLLDRSGGDARAAGPIPVPSRLPAEDTELTPEASPLSVAFGALLAEEQGELPPPSAAALSASPLDLNQTMVDRIADGVADRLTTGALGDSLRHTVHEVSERLVREEIRRIREDAQRNLQKH